MPSWPTRNYVVAIGIATVLLITSRAAYADIVIPGADGSDGALNITSNTTIDLSQAPSANWDKPSPQPGKGVYDASKWAVVFKYSSVNIASGATLTFANHISRAPVVWLVNGNVTIAGTVSLDGAAGSTSMTATLPGPGGFRGGTSWLSSSEPNGWGFGPGGGGTWSGYTGGYSSYAYYNGSPGSYSTLGGGNAPGTTYGNTLLVPLIGGSGGTAGDGSASSAGGGGGAILIAASGQFSLTGTLRSVGGLGAVNGNSDNRSTGSGSGGAIRVIAASMSGTGLLDARGGATGPSIGGDGRIRLETVSGGDTLRSTPSTAIDTPSSPALLWPPDSAPSVRVAAVGDKTVTTTPLAQLGPSPADVNLYSTAPITITIETRNVVTTSAKVTLRVTPKHGAAFNVSATYASGSTDTALWTAQVSVPQGFSALQPRVDPK